MTGSTGRAAVEHVQFERLVSAGFAVPDDCPSGCFFAVTAIGSES